MSWTGGEAKFERLVGSDDASELGAAKQRTAIRS
jgi:hypothetical protein